jgi:hypothetical protein
VRVPKFALFFSAGTPDNIIDDSKKNLSGRPHMGSISQPKIEKIAKNTRL